MSDSQPRALVVERSPSGEVVRRVQPVPRPEPAEDEVLVRSAWSAVNYKDALASRAHPGIVKRLPHVPGIDLAGEVVESRSPRFRPGDQVLAGGYGVGAERWGGWSELAAVPAACALAPPSGLSLRTAMLYGSAGLTAAMCAEELLKHGVTPEQGEVVVTGASGGVGSLAVQLLAKLGYRVAAVTGKPAWRERLLRWGAARVLGREELARPADKPLLSARWAGAVDVAGGAPLAAILRETAPLGCVTCCGLTAGTDLPLTVYPFILRGVSLVGIDCAMVPFARRCSLWERLAGAWSLPHLEEVAREASLEELEPFLEAMLAGRAEGRVAVRVGKEG